jgi:Ser/Thr protein kinase RdoA (MazF antagonist)
LTGPGGECHLLKIWNHTQDPAVVDFQTGALKHIRKTASSLPVPRIIPDTLGGHWRFVTDASGLEHPACVLSWLDGTFLRDVPPDPELRVHLGEVLAELDQALASYQHSAQARDMLWDLSRVDRLRPLTGSVENAATRKRVEQAVRDFEHWVIPLLPNLRRQVIHGDFNLDNVLVDAVHQWRVSGIIDFGDALEAPRVCELAVAGAYQLAGGPDPLAGVIPVVRGYHRVNRLDDSEIKALPALLRARLVSSVVITSHMARLHPENSEYLLIDTANAADRLHRLELSTIEEDVDRLARACTPT